MPSNQVLWTIDNELDGSKFERLCVDILFRNGYREIVPIEPQDGGRDAVERPRRGRSQEGFVSFFQFSMEKDWKRKLRTDAQKLSQRRTEFSTLIFVTSQKARGVDLDDLTIEIQNQYGWMLIVYSREWLRLQLEIAHTDIANKYLGIDSKEISSRVYVPELSSVSFGPASERVKAQIFDEQTVADLKTFLKDNPESSAGWQALAWSNYSIYRLDDALSDINRAIKLKQNVQAQVIRASILVEKGLSEKNKFSIKEGLSIYEELLKSTAQTDWHIHYNIGNALGGLDRHSEAIDSFKKAIESEPQFPDIWKNLATSYHQTGDHQAEIECLNTALELDPLHPESLVAKGVTLLMDFEKPKEAVPYFEKALRYCSDIHVKWPHIWYWAARAHYTSDSPKLALARIEDGLMHQPGDKYLRGLKSEILFALLPTTPEIQEEARRHWKSQIENEKRDYDARMKLVRLELHAGNDLTAWNLLEECFTLCKIEPLLALRNSGFSVDQCIIALKFLPQYAAFRTIQPVSDYWNPNHPLYSFRNPPPFNNRFESALNSYLAIAFGLGCSVLDTHKDAPKDRETFISFFDELSRNLETAIGQATRELATEVPPKSGGVEAVSTKLAEIILFVGEVSIREFVQQRIWIANNFGVAPPELIAIVGNYDESTIERETVEITLKKLNEQLKIFPD